MKHTLNFRNDTVVMAAFAMPLVAEARHGGTLRQRLSIQVATYAGITAAVITSDIAVS